MNYKKTLIIAEAGVNHNGEIKNAFALIDAAANAGADLVKFQSFKAINLVTQDASKAEYQKKTTDSSESQFEMIKRLELSYEDHVKLENHCNKKEIGFFSTGFDIDSIDMLMEFKLSHIKIPSGEINNLPYLRHIAGKKKPVIMSTGMANMEEIRDALRALVDAGLDKRDLCILHCNTQYPTPMEDVNLKAMLTIKEQFDVEVGYSDHTMGIEIPIAAVALGAKVIEKHITLDRNMIGPDHSSSLEPVEFKDMVKSIRNIEKSLGDGIKRPSASEIKNIPIIRKSIVASMPIKKGDRLSSMNIAIKRPGTGLSPMKWDDLLGLPAKKDFKIDDLIEL